MPQINEESAAVRRAAWDHLWRILLSQSPPTEPYHQPVPADGSYRPLHEAIPVNQDAAGTALPAAPETEHTA